MHPQVEAVLSLFLDFLYLTLLGATLYRKELGDRAKAAVGTLFALIMPYIVIQYTSLRPALITSVYNAYVYVVERNAPSLFSPSQSPPAPIADIVLSYLVERPFNNPVLDALYTLGIAVYTSIITASAVAVSVIRSIANFIARLVKRGP